MRSALLYSNLRMPNSVPRTWTPGYIMTLIAGRVDNGAARLLRRSGAFAGIIEIV
jgi:hypothetical protein